MSVRPLRLGRPRTAPNEVAALLAEIARGLAGHLRRSLHADVRVASLEPRVIEAQALESLLEACVILGWSAARGDLVVIADVASAQACAGAALGAVEPPRGGRLSPLEREVFGGIVAATLPALRPLCGELRGEAAARVVPGDLFLEFTLAPSPLASLGVALHPTALPPPGPPLEVESLAEVPMTLSVEFARGSLTFAELADLAPGDVIVFETQVGRPAVLKVGDQAAFIGDPGVEAGRAAFALTGTLTRNGE